MNLIVPNSTSEMDTLLEEAKILLKSNSYEDDVADEIWSACKHLANLAGSFNHNVTRQHREKILNLLAINYDNAIDPVLQSLVDCPRAEQFDVVKSFISRL